MDHQSRICFVKQALVCKECLGAEIFFTRRAIDQDRAGQLPGHGFQRKRSAKSCAANQVMSAAVTDLGQGIILCEKCHVFPCHSQ